MAVCGADGCGRAAACVPPARHRQAAGSVRLSSPAVHSSTAVLGHWQITARGRSRAKKQTGEGPEASRTSVSGPPSQQWHTRHRGAAPLTHNGGNPLHFGKL